MNLEVSIRGDLEPSVRPLTANLAHSRFVESLLAQDPALWGPAAAVEARQRLGWALNPSRWRKLAAEIDEAHKKFESQGINRFLLCGMGGSSLGPEVIAGSEKLSLSVVDTTHPDELAKLINDDLSKSLVVISSKSGLTLETECHRLAFEEAFQAQAIDASQHIIVVTDPGSPLHIEAQAKGYQIFEGDPTIGGRYSAISPFGLVPTGLAGLDLKKFLNDAEYGFQLCADPSANNPAAKLAAAITAGGHKNTKLLVNPDPHIPGFFDWIEQLLAESSGKEGTGILPLKYSPSGGVLDCRSVGAAGSGADIEISGSLGAQMVLWLFATAIACAEIQVNPFDQPNVESSKVAAREQLNSAKSKPIAIGTTAGFDLLRTSTPGKMERDSGLESLILSISKDQNYLAICAFAPRQNIVGWEALQKMCMEIVGKPVSLGFGPRFLHSTGQLHKGGPQDGSFLQIIQYPTSDLSVPGHDFSFSDLVFAQAAGDARVLESQGLPVVQLGGDYRAIELLLAKCNF